MKFGGLLTLEVEIELLVELECAVVVLPVLAEELQEPLLCDLGAAIIILVLALVGSLREGLARDRLGIVDALAR